MANHISNEDLQTLLEQFLHENPYGDSFDLARFMYEKGWAAGMTKTCELF